MATAMDPTPPDAPVTRTGPSPGHRPRSSSAWTLIAAVNPAVPMAIASRAVRPSGSGTTQPDGIRASSPYPPWRAVPMSYPFARTLVPTGNASSSEATTVPARSMPGTSG